MSKRKALAIFGTRPEAIKMCPLVREMQARETFDMRVAVTGQHRELLHEVLNLFRVTPAHDLALMTENQSQTGFLAALLTALPAVLATERPDLVLVHGDTASTYGAALVAFLSGIPVAHIEAGLRTYDLAAPFPEEYYRQAVARIAHRHFAPTARAKENLLSEGIPEDRIFVTGNTGIDALAYTVRREAPPAILAAVRDRRLVMVTAHRRENHGAPLREMLLAIRAVARARQDIFVLLSAHPNPAVCGITRELFACEENCLVLPSQSVSDFHTLLSHAHLVLTDSGGIQEEAPALGVPVLVMRNTTERVEGLRAGTLCLAGTTFESVSGAFRRLLDDDALHAQMRAAENPYGDGRASARIADILERKI